MEARQYKIIQASAQDLLFVRCAKCKEKIIFVTRNEFVYGRETCYCAKCKEIKTTSQDKKVTYKIGLAVLDIQTNKMESIVLYDDEAAKVLGRLPPPFLEDLKQDKWMSKKVEEQLVGLYCSASVAKAKNSVRKARKVQFLYTDQFNLVDSIQASTDDITFDASVL